MKTSALVATAMLVFAPAALAAPQLLDCARSPLPDLCKEAQVDYTRKWSRSPTEYGNMRNIAYCLWTGCDRAFQPDRRASCVIRRHIMLNHVGKTDRSDDTHFANCVSAGL